MFDIRGTKGVSKTYFKSKPCREGGLFFANLYFLQGMSASSQNLQLELLISLNCAGRFYGCFRQDAIDGHFHIYIPRQKMCLT